MPNNARKECFLASVRISICFKAELSNVTIIYNDKWNFSPISGKWRISYFQGHVCDNSGFEWPGKDKGTIHNIRGDRQPIDSKLWSVSRQPSFLQPCSRKTVPIQTHEQARKQDYLITWKLSLPLQLLEEPVTVGLPRTQGQMPALGECIPKLTPGPRDSQWDPPSRTEGPTLASVFQLKGLTLQRKNPTFTGSGWGKGRGANTQVLLDNHFQPCLTSVQQFDAIHQEPRCIWDISFLSLLKKFF